MNATTPHIGLNQARQLCQMPHEERLTFLSEGLPIILSSAQGFWQASCQLKDKPREAEVLEGFAEEEAAKILILMDAVRCPKTLIDSKIGQIIRWFYNHLARLIYAKAVSWQPINVTQLREYVAHHRESHFLQEAAYGAHILPNWSLYERNSKLYADIQAGEGGALSWNDPSPIFQRSDPATFASFPPLVLKPVKAMAALGIFTAQGLKATSEIWGQRTFTNTEYGEDACRLTVQLINRLCVEDLPRPEATQDHANDLFRYWQLPMYDFDFSQIDAQLEELKEEQELIGWADGRETYL